MITEELKRYPCLASTYSTFLTTDTGCVMEYIYNIKCVPPRGGYALDCGQGKE